MNSIHLKALIFLSSIFLVACSPHPATGVWVSDGDNELGFSKIIVAFDGRAEFTSSKPIETNWHCFWTKVDKKTLELDCSSSKEKGLVRQFAIISKNYTDSEFVENGKVLAVLKRIDENPVF